MSNSFKIIQVQGSNGDLDVTQNSGGLFGYNLNASGFFSYNINGSDKGAGDIPGLNSFSDVQDLPIVKQLIDGYQDILNGTTNNITNDTLNFWANFFQFTNNSNSSSHIQGLNFSFLLPDVNGNVIVNNKSSSAVIVSSDHILPNAKPLSVTVPESFFQSFSIGLAGTDSDLDNKALTFKIVNAPNHGSVTLVPSSLHTTVSSSQPILSASENASYIPLPGYYGPDSFTYTVTDGDNNTSAKATVNITVKPDNILPLATSENLSTKANTALNIALKGSDSDLDVGAGPGPFGLGFHFSIASAPHHGTLSLITHTTITSISLGGLTETAKVVYTPTAGYNGPDSFTYTVNDGANSSLVSQGGTVTIKVGSAQVPPQPTNPVITGDGEDTPLTFIADQSLVNGTPNEYGLATDATSPHNLSISSVAAGIVPVSIVNGHVIYDPGKSAVFAGLANGQTLQDSFHYTVTDGTTSVNGTVTVNVVGDYVPPTAVPDNATTDPILSTLSNQSIVIHASELLANDINGDSDEDTLFLTAIDSTKLQGLISNIQYTDAAHTYISQFTYSPVGHFTLAPGVSTIDSLGYTITDSFGQTSSSTATLTVIGAPSPPIVIAESANTGTDTAVLIGLAGADPVDNNIFNYSIVNAPLHGMVSFVPNTTHIVPDGVGGLTSSVNVIYTPDPGFSGIDNFTYKANDGTSDSSPATVNVSVDIPVAVNVSNDFTQAGGTITLFGKDTDSDNLLSSGLNFIIVNGPLHGTITSNNDEIVNSTYQGALHSFGLNSTLSYQYTPDPGFSGMDSFTYKVNDGSHDSAIATASITVDLPIAQNENAGTDDLMPVTITLQGTDSDSDNNNLNFIIVNQPLHGTISFVPNTLVTNPDNNGGLVGSVNVIYTPNNPSYQGLDSFTYKVNDGVNDSAPATVSLTVNEPVALPDNDVIRENLGGSVQLGVTIQLNGTDTDTDNLSASGLIFTIVDQPLHGTLTFNNDEGSSANGFGLHSTETYQYTPNPGYYGFDSFTYKVNDGSEDSVAAKINIVVLPDTDLPSAQSESLTSEEGPITVMLRGRDSDQDLGALNFQILTQPTNGTLSLITNEISTNHGGVVSSAQVVYTPNPGFTGLDAFSYVVNDGFNTSTPANVLLTINPSDNIIPLAKDESAVVSLDNLVSPGVSIQLQGFDRDFDNGSLNFSIVNGPAHGTLSSITLSGGFGRGGAVNENAIITYTPDPNYSGPDSFTYKVNDGAHDSAPATVNIIVDQPIAQDVSTSVAENLGGSISLGASITLVGTDSDTESSDPSITPDLTFTILTQPTHGTLVFNNDLSTSGDGLGGLVSTESYTYTPNLNFSGFDTFTYKVNDGAVDSAPATVTIGVDVPIADSQNLRVIEDQNPGATILLNGNDTDNDGTYSFAIVSGPLHGTLSSITDQSISDLFPGVYVSANIIYTPDLHYVGSDSFMYTLTDDLLTSTVATVRLNVAPNLPKVNSPSYSVNEDSTLVIPISTAANGLLYNDSPDISLSNLDFSGVHGVYSVEFLNSANMTLDFSSALGLQSITLINGAYYVLNMVNGIDSITKVADGYLPFSISYSMSANTLENVAGGSASTDDFLNFSVINSEGNSNRGFVDVTVNDLPPVIHTPDVIDVLTLPADAGATAIDTQLLSLSGASDPDSAGVENNSLQIANITPAQNASGVPHGFFDLSPGADTYTPVGFDYLKLGQTAFDNYTYQVADSHGVLSTPAAFSIQVNGVYIPPVANSDFFAANVGQDLIIPISALLSNDVDPQDTISVTSLSFGSYSGPSSMQTVDVSFSDGSTIDNVQSVTVGVGGNTGTVMTSTGTDTIAAGVTPTFIDFLMPTDTFNSVAPGLNTFAENFTYAISDTQNTPQSTSTTVDTINVISPISYMINENTTLNIALSSLLAVDSNDPNSPFISKLDFTGSASFDSFTVMFAGGATFSNVSEVDYLSPGTYNVVIAGITPITVTGVGDPTTILYNMGANEYDTLTAASSLQDHFAYTISDSSNNNISNAVNITVNDLPPVINQNADIIYSGLVNSESGQVNLPYSTLLAIASDSDGGNEQNALNVVNIMPANSNGPHGSITPEDGFFLYQPPASFQSFLVGTVFTDNFFYQVEDSHGLLSNLGIFTVDVPVVYHAALATAEDIPVSNSSLNSETFIDVINNTGPLLSPIYNPQGYHLTVTSLDFSNTTGLVNVLFETPLQQVYLETGVHIVSYDSVNSDYVVSLDNNNTFTTGIGDKPVNIEYTSGGGDSSFNYSITDGTTPSTATATLTELTAVPVGFPMDQYDGGLVIPTVYHGAQYTGVDNSLIPLTGMLGTDHLVNNLDYHVNVVSTVTNGSVAPSSTGDNLEFILTNNPGVTQAGFDYFFSNVGDGSTSNTASVYIPINSIGGANILPVGNDTITASSQTSAYFVGQPGINIFAVNSDAFDPVNVYGYDNTIGFDTIGNNLPTNNPAINNGFSIESGADRISGGLGNVLIKPGYGPENILGGLGVATYLYDTPVTNYANNYSTIHDFQSGVDAFEFAKANPNDPNPLNNNNGFFVNVPQAISKFSTTNGPIQETTSIFTEDVADHDLWFHNIIPNGSGGLVDAGMTRLVHFTNDVVLTANDIHII